MFMLRRYINTAYYYYYFQIWMSNSQKTFENRFVYLKQIQYSTKINTVGCKIKYLAQNVILLK